MNPSSTFYIVRLTGGTVLRMPAGRGPECVYDRLLKVLAECEVDVITCGGGAEWHEWHSGTEAVSSAVAFRADERAAEANSPLTK